ncbi:hypothetical protein [Mesonia maritima]|uniref:Uncharacterized protein n=1 Tax=Mesonia maritima TaxID=1793873 RepID=A0ABU1K6I4_9FLAO|nr:hypothetical protein [Mesonia maritima]MDR6301215.1 hypothetical protein [Mesonia maritima]
MNKYVKKIPTKILRIIPISIAIIALLVRQAEFFSHMTMLVITLALIPLPLVVLFELKRRRKTEVTEF